MATVSEMHAEVIAFLEGKDVPNVAALARDLRRATDGVVVQTHCFMAMAIDLSRRMGVDRIALMLVENAVDQAELAVGVDTGQSDLLAQALCLQVRLFDLVGDNRRADAMVERVKALPQPGSTWQARINLALGLRNLAGDHLADAYSQFGLASALLGMASGPIPSLYRLSAAGEAFCAHLLRADPEAHERATRHLAAVSGLAEAGYVLPELPIAELTALLASPPPAGGPTESVPEHLRALRDQIVQAI